MSKKTKEIKLMNITSARELRGLLAKLQGIIVGAKPKRNEIIKGEEEGAYWEITKERTSNNPDFFVYAFRASGFLETRKSLVAQLTIFLGEPILQNKILPDIDSVCWHVKQIDEEAVD